MTRTRAGLARLLWPRAGREWRRVVHGALHALAAGLGFVWSIPLLGLSGWGLVVLLYVAVAQGYEQARPGGGWVALRWACRLAQLLVLAVLLYASLSFGSMLGWAIPFALRVALGALLALSLRSAWRPLAGIQLPLALPLGLLVTLSVAAWSWEAGVLRCEDHERVVAQPGVSLLLPSLGGQAACRDEGRSRMRPYGYPRRLYPTASPGRFLLATELGEEDAHDEDALLDGGICELVLVQGEAGATSARVSGCAHLAVYHLVQDPSRDEIIAAGQPGLVRLGDRPPFPLRARADVGERTPTLVVRVEAHDPDVLIAFFDDLEPGRRFDALSLRDLGAVDAVINPAALRYDASTGEGLYCFGGSLLYPVDGQGFQALAFDGDPTALRLLAPTSRNPLSWLVFSDGCDFDRPGRRAYAGAATLGGVSVLDYDTGEMVDWLWTGFGVRDITLDPTRRRLYTSSFFSGEVQEHDLESGRLLRSWFAGRFLRHLLVSADGDSLYASSSAGIVEISL